MKIFEVDKIENIVFLRIIFISAFFLNNSREKWSDSHA
jgi:hypothetical protein